jgi:c-di-GMP-binding flagellar brake protein YcgR
MKNMSDEKRKYKRIKSDFSVRIRRSDPRLSLDVGNSVNVSATGILFRHDRPLEMGTMLNVRFLKPNSFDFFEGNAKVVRVEMCVGESMYEIGVQFLDMSDSDQRKLNYYIGMEEG